MDRLVERIRNVWTDDLERPDPPELRFEHTTGRHEVAEDLTKDLDDLAQQIRRDWTADRLTQSVSPEESATYYRGQIDAYNRIASAIHDHDTAGRIDIGMLPEIMDVGEIQRGVEHAVSMAELQRNAQPRTPEYVAAVEAEQGPKEERQPEYSLGFGQ